MLRDKWRPRPGGAHGQVPARVPFLPSVPGTFTQSPWLLKFHPNPTFPQSPMKSVFAFVSLSCPGLPVCWVNRPDLSDYGLTLVVLGLWG